MAKLLTVILINNNNTHNNVIINNKSVNNTCINIDPHIRKANVIIDNKTSLTAMVTTPVTYT